MTSGALADRLQDSLDLLATFAPSTDELRSLQATKNAIEARMAHLVDEMTDTLEHETEGYSTPKTWLRDQLHLDTRQVNELIAAGPTLRDLPEVDAAAENGELSLDHVRHFTYALTHVGEQTRQHVADLVPVATTSEPVALKHCVKKLREAVYPESLDQAWIDGMAKEDLQVNPVPDGWHVSGFLPVETGAKLNTLLQSLSAPTGADDPRTGPQRRVDALDQLLDSILEHGLPTDQGVRPHLTLRIDVADLLDGRGADLAGFGRIGPAQLQQMLCTGDLTPVLTAGKHAVLDVGRTQRLATAKQRVAVMTRQDGRCAGPGCRAPAIHVHHVRYWSHGGPTDLDNLIGLCPRCHTQVHRGVVTIDHALAA